MAVKIRTAVVRLVKLSRLSFLDIVTDWKVNIFCKQVTVLDFFFGNCDNRRIKGMGE
jgi:hypothetical protein